MLIALSASGQARDVNASNKKKVLVALSGGIDSAVSAYLLIKKGYYVEGAFMKNWTSQEGLLKNECPWLSDRRDALRVSAFLGIKMHTLDFEKQYQNTVMKYFFNEYKKGRTPNPDVMCNKEIKFKLLYNWAIKNGFDFLATGHYARVQELGIRNYELGIKTQSYCMKRSVDEFKDQTYFIYNIRTEQLPHLLFPIGGMKKTAVRDLARKIGLPNAEKRESMGLCFVGKIRLKDFLQQKLTPKPGKIVQCSLSSLRGAPNAYEGRRGNLFQDKIASSQSLLAMTTDEHASLAMTELVIGQHEGLHNYTIGQRQGIKVGGGAGPYFVFGKDLKANRLLVTNDPEDPRLLTKEVQIHSVNWLTPDLRFKIEDLRLKGRYRHQGEIVSLAISQIKKDLYRVIFKTPQKAVASGQSLVLYKGKVCVGGGIVV